MTEWRRNPTPTGVCACGHIENAHRIDLKRMRCDTGGCDCPEYDLTALQWREHRTVKEEL